MEITLNFGNSYDETDVGLGWQSNYIYINTDTKEIDWECGYDKQYGYPKSDSPADVVEFVKSNWQAFNKQGHEDYEIEEFCEILLKKFNTTHKMITQSQTVDLLKAG